VTERAPGPSERGRRPLTQEDRARFLELLSAGYSVTHAAKAIGRSRGLLYAARDQDARFGDEWASAWQEGADRLEDEARRRGVEEPVFQRGEQVGTVRKYSDPLLLAQLGSRRPEWRRNAPVVEVGVVDREPQPVRFAGGSVLGGLRILAELGVEVRALAERAAAGLNHSPAAARELEAGSELATGLVEQAAQPAHVIEHDPRSLSSPERNPEAGA
jgi:transposase-like protein